MAVIHTKRLLLRPAVSRDLHAFHAILSDARAMAYWSTLPHKTIEQTRKWFQGMLDIPLAEGEDFVVEHEGRVIGKAGLYRFPEIGFIFHPNSWGRGFATEALQAILTRAFKVHGLATVDANVDPRNGASLLVLAKLGFRETRREKRTWLIGDQWCDSVYLSVSRSHFLDESGAP